MKTYSYLIFLFLLFISCSKDNPSPVTYETLNISDFSSEIIKPEKQRDISYYNQGSRGTYENPDSLIRFKGKVDISYVKSNSKQLSPSEIEIEWKSNIDGTLFAGSLDDDFESYFTKQISKGIHEIVFSAYVSRNNELLVTDTVTISNVIALETLSTDRSVKLKWSKYVGNNFLSYKIYRDNYEPIAEIPDIDQTSFEDFNAVLSENYTYQIIVETSGTNQPANGSNIQLANAGNYIKLDYYITKCIYDSERNRIYAIVGERGIYSNYANEYGLIILDCSQDTIAVVSHLFKNDRFSDLDIDLDNRYLFLCQRRGESVFKLDLSSLELTQFTVDTRGWGIHKIEAGANSRVYCYRTPPTSGGSTIYIVDGSNGNLIRSSGYMVHGDIEYSQLTNKIYHGTSTRDKMVVMLSVDNDVIDWEKTFEPFIGWPKAFILLSEDGESIFWEHFQLDKDLNVVREFEHGIICIDNESAYISDGKKVMKHPDLDLVMSHPEFPVHKLRNEIITNKKELIVCNSNEPITSERYSYLFKLKLTDQ